MQGTHAILMLIYELELFLLTHPSSSMRYLPPPPRSFFFFSSTDPRRWLCWCQCSGPLGERPACLCNPGAALADWHDVWVHT